MGHITHACEDPPMPPMPPPPPEPDAWDRWGRQVVGVLLLAILVVATITFGYAVVGERVAAFCIPEAAP